MLVFFVPESEGTKQKAVTHASICGSTSFSSDHKEKHSKLSTHNNLRLSCFPQIKLKRAIGESYLH